MKKRNINTRWMYRLCDTPLRTGKSCLMAAAVTLLLSACGGGSDSDNPSSPNPTPNPDSGDNTISKVSFDLELPDSVTGGQITDASQFKTMNLAKGVSAVASGASKPGDLPCAYIGTDSDDPFANGYEATKFMVSAVATWGCVADLLIVVADLVPHDGTIIETDNDLNADNYEEDEPTHYSVIDDSDVQTSVRLYYGYDRAEPPTNDDLAGFYLSWTKDQDGTLRGRMIIDTVALAEEHRPEDPEQMRMDFVEDEQSKVHDMVLRFGEENLWADGLRIRVTKQLDVNPLETVFIAQGLMAMTAQFLPIDGIDELPDVRFYSIANQMGDGASIAQLNDLALIIPLNFERSLGNYLTSKEDIYFFDDDQQSAEPWDWIEKSFTTGEYRGSRTALETDGSWIPFNPSLDMVETALELESGYFTTTCAEVGDDCAAFMNAVFIDGFAEQETNQGTDPNDWRSLALQSASYLDTVYPNGVDWTDAFVQEFQP